MHHPKYMQKLFEETKSVLPTQDISDLTYAKVQSLPYLEAVINETFRFRPVAAGILPRDVPEGGANILGYDLPAGATVGGSAYVLHHYSGNFSDPETFNPDRWFNQDEETLTKMQKAIVPFSFGARSCLGRALAMLELKLVLTGLVRLFDFDFVPGKNMTPANKFVLRPQDVHVDCHVRKRKE